MLIKTGTVLVLSAMIAATLPASAQTKWMEIGDNVMVGPFNMTAGAMEDLDVYDPAGKRIGEIEEVLGTDANTPLALSVDFDDNAGYGDRDDVVIPLDEFEMTDNRFVLNADANAVSGMKTYDD